MLDRDHSIRKRLVIIAIHNHTHNLTLIVKYPDRPLEPCNNAKLTTKWSRPPSVFLCTTSNVALSGASAIECGFRNPTTVTRSPVVATSQILHTERYRFSLNERQVHALNGPNYLQQLVPNRMVGSFFEGPMPNRMAGLLVKDMSCSYQPGTRIEGRPTGIVPIALEASVAKTIHTACAGVVRYGSSGAQPRAALV